MAVWVGKFSVKGYGLGMVAAAVVVGAALPTWASTYGVKLQLDNFAKSLFYYLFMYGVGLRVGPSFFNSLKKDGLKFTILAVVCSVTGLALVVICREAVRAAGRRGRRHPGRLADHVGGDRHGRDGGVAGRLQDPGRLHRGADLRHDRAGLWRDLHLGHDRHHPDLQVSAALVGHGRRKAAKEYELAHGVTNVDDAGLTGYRPGGLRAYRLENPAVAGQIDRAIPPVAPAVPDRQCRARRRQARGLARPGARARRRHRPRRPARGSDGEPRA